jgi:large subunit ribosomal protein L25
MEQILLNAQERQMKGKMVKQLRRTGLVPAVVYGHRSEPLSLQIEARALQTVLQEAGTSRLITLNVEGLEAPKMVLVRELQRDALNHRMLHVDLYEVIMTERITAEVPVVLIGESALVKSGAGLLFEGLDSIEIECLPGDLPEEFEVDVTGLTEIDAALLVKDLKLPEGVEILTDLDEVVVKILPPEKEEVEEVVVAEAPAEVEVVGKEKKAEADTGEEGKAEKKPEKEKAEGKPEKERSEKGK